MKSPFKSLYRFIWVLLPFCWAGILATAWGVGQLTRPSASERLAACRQAVATARDGWFHIPTTAGGPDVADPEYLRTAQTRAGALLAGSPYLSASEAYAEAPLVARQRGLPLRQVRALVAAHL